MFFKTVFLLDYIIVCLFKIRCNDDIELSVAKHAIIVNIEYSNTKSGNWTMRKKDRLSMGKWRFFHVKYKWRFEPINLLDNLSTKLDSVDRDLQFSICKAS
jgi:hypothetical protein